MVPGSFNLVRPLVLGGREGDAFTRCSSGRQSVTHRSGGRVIMLGGWLLQVACHSPSLAPLRTEPGTQATLPRPPPPTPHLPPNHRHLTPLHTSHPTTHTLHHHIHLTPPHASHPTAHTSSPHTSHHYKHLTPPHTSNSFCLS